MIREASVAGQFYPGTKQALGKMIDGLIEKGAKKQKAIGVMSPHAGYACSGYVAGALFSRVKLPDTFIIMGPNHTGSGRPFSVMTEDAWKTPMGKMAVDSELARMLLDKVSFIQDDPAAHAFEHSIEVQLPILQYLKPDCKFVPLSMSAADLDTYKQIGKAIGEVIKAYKKEVLIIASSDLTHYEPHEVAQAKDKKAIDAILQLDEDLLFKTIEDFDISMCGYVPTIAMLSAAKVLGAKNAGLVKYQTSGETTGDYAAVVGYAGIMVA